MIYRETGGYSLIIELFEYSLNIAGENLSLSANIERLCSNSAQYNRKIAGK